uniref:tumor necrosis factor receptor superfamily member 10B-like isoform X2 n=1 Tax=Pristiophorus japonicus TaxID=55135 RepID=UPI00398F6B7E
MALFVCGLALTLGLVQGLPVHEDRITSRLPGANISSTFPGKEQAGDQNEKNQTGNVVTRGTRIIRDVGLRTTRFYPVDNRYCRKCPAGTHVEEHCTESYNRGKCLPCVDGEDYTEWDNGLEKCLPCPSCTEDKEMVSQCTAHSKTMCQCRTGSFCLPGQPCEMCLTCKTHCPEGQIFKKRCNATWDNVCERTEITAGQPSDNESKTSLVIGAIVAVCLLLIVVCVCSRVCCWKMRCKDQRSDPASEPVTRMVNESESAAAGGGESAPDAAEGKMDNDQAPKEKATLLRNSPEASAQRRVEASLRNSCGDEVGPGSSSELGSDPPIGQAGLVDPNELINVSNLNTLQNCGDTGDEMGGPVGTRFVERFSASYYKPMVNGNGCLPLNNKLNNEDLRQSFQIFIQEVPHKRWKEFMRRLYLTENEIVAAEQNNDSIEGHYQMLCTWYQKLGHAASVEILVNTLYKMDLLAAAHNIQTWINSKTKEH